MKAVLMWGKQCDKSGRTPGTPARNPSVVDVGSEFASKVCCQALYRSLLFIFIETGRQKASSSPSIHYYPYFSDE